SEDVQLLVGLAQCYRALQEPEKARTLLRRVLDEQPDNVEALLTLALVEKAAGNDTAVVNLLDRLESLAARPTRRRTLESLLSLQPVAHAPAAPEQQMTILYLRAGALRGLGRDKEAVECLVRHEQLWKDLAALKKLVQEQKSRPGDG